MNENIVDLESMGRAARVAGRLLAKLDAAVKNEALKQIVEGISARQGEVLAANEQDLKVGRGDGLSDSLLDRLALDSERMDALIADVRKVAALPDPLSERFDVRQMPNGLRVGKRRVPLGVIGAIYESRPNITVDFAVLSIKSGNALILRGGREAIRTNSALVGLIRGCIEEAGVPPDAVQFVESPDRALVGQMLGMKEYIDLMVPRGGNELVQRVASDATMPAVIGGIGVCHTYVDRAADDDMAVEIAYNAKVSRPSVCNAMDTLLVHAAAAPSILPRLALRWAEVGVEMRCDRRALSILGSADVGKILPAVDDDWGTEFLSLTAAVKIVDTLDEALEHIATYGSGHSEAIVTEDYSAANRFLDEVDAAVVFVNASTRFNDGGQMGLGAEVAISTNKFHARGPMGLRELTSYKWTVEGSGQIR